MNTDEELNPPFDVLEPAHWRGPVLFNSPHSGRVYPREFLAVSRLDLPTLRRSEDTFVDELVAGVVERGYPLIRAHFPRCYVDVNREPNTRSMRVAGGLGTVARVVGDAQEIYDQRISIDDALQRIESLYKPYHRALRRLFGQIHKDFGVAILIDCHSMPSATASRDDRPRADIVLGDRYGTSCVAMISETVEDALRELGYAVSRNKPYAGGFITEHYGNPGAGLHAIQLEINRAIYMDEKRYERGPDFERVAADLETLADRVAEIPAEELRPYRSAAE
jgi:N-formylglutamate amidohydrolase